MKKSTIISGPTCSGKSWIAKAIANQYQEHLVFIINVPEFYDQNGMFKSKTKDLSDKYDLIVFDDCTSEDEIYVLQHLFYTNGYKGSLIFVTRLEIENEGDNRYHIINAKNKTF